MEEKKKKGKKKKKYQSKHSGSILIAENVNQTTPDESVSNAEILLDNYHDAAPVQNHHMGASSNADSQSVGVSESDVDQVLHKNPEAKTLYKNLQGSLEERIKLLQNEVDSCILKEASLEEKIDDLHGKNVLLVTREGSLEERIKLLQNEVDSCIQKEANIKERVKKVEEMNHSFALEENSIKEVLSKLGDANEGLQMQVMELKGSRDSLAQENKQLGVIISTLESRIQHLEMVASFYASSKIHGEEESHLKAAEASTKPDILNEDPSEKASLIHAKPVQLAGTSENPTVKSSTSTDYASEFHNIALESNEKIETSAKSNDKFGVNGAESLGSTEELEQIQLLGSGDSTVSEDTVSVPLEDIIEELELEPVVPLSDAPLIGAPFRLISFVARFVSGSDLVDQVKSKADR